MKRQLELLLSFGVWILLAIVWGCFAILNPQFLTPTNLLNILVQSASTAVVATGMTFVLLTSGVDLSVGAIMFVAAAIAGKMATASIGMPWVIVTMIVVSMLLGACNGSLVVGVGLLPFIATLGTLYIARGFSLWLCETRAINMPESYLQVSSSHLLGIPTPIIVLAFVVLTGQFILSKTAFGRHIYAVGFDRTAAEKAGLNTKRILFFVYVISGLAAGIGAILTLSQLGAVSPTFGERREFSAIAAAVLGGTSLFGGRGNVLPGTLVGAVLMQSVENGLNLANADPYLYPMIVAAVIFIAVLLDGIRSALQKMLLRRPIMLD